MRVQAFNESIQQRVILCEQPEPRKFNGRNVRSWVKSIQNLIETEKTAPTEEQEN